MARGRRRRRYGGPLPVVADPGAWTAPPLRSGGGPAADARRPEGAACSTAAPQWHHSWVVEHAGRSRILLWSNCGALPNFASPISSIGPFGPEFCGSSSSPMTARIVDRNGTALTDRAWAHRARLAFEKCAFLAGFWVRSQPSPYLCNTTIEFACSGRLGESLAGPLGDEGFTRRRVQISRLLLGLTVPCWPWSARRTRVVRDRSREPVGTMG